MIGKNTVSFGGPVGDLMSRGRHLRDALRKRGMVQADLWHATKRIKDPVSKQAISDIISGKTAPKVETLEKLARALNTTVEDIYPNYAEHVEAERNARGGRRTFAPTYDAAMAVSAAPKVSFSDDMRTAHITMSQTVSTDTAQKIVELVKNDVANGS